MDLPRLPHIHAENCPRRAEEGADSHAGFPDILWREDARERGGWDGMGQRLGMTPLGQVASALDGYGRAAPQQGSYAQTFFIMANDVAKAERVVQAASALLKSHDLGDAEFTPELLELRTALKAIDDEL